MNFRYNLVRQTDGGEEEKQFKTLKEISEELNVELHLIRKINNLTENYIKSERPHKCHRELFDKVKIYNIKKEYKI